MHSQCRTLATSDLGKNLTMIPVTDKETRCIKTKYPNNCFDYVSIIADGTSVSTFLFTSKLRFEEVGLSRVAVHRSLMN